ncbi:MAG: SDR family oxidoreductase [Candidatus Thermoplasmatota archaeon]
MKDEKSLKDNVALVTGASSGIGKAICERLAKGGIDLGLAARRENKLEAVANELSEKHDVQTLVMPTDVTVEEEVNKMVEKTVDKYGRLDILVNNAGVIRYGDVEDFSTEDYKTMMETNCDGMFYTTRAALPHVKKNGGNLVYIGSFDANHPRSFNPIYAATKWWTKGFAHSIESIVGKEGVAVTLVNPSEVRTDIKDKEGKKYKKKFDPEEVIDPEEIAEAVFFALNQKNSTTASEINVFRRDKMSDFF